MVTLNDLIAKGGKKYLPQGDYVAEIKIAKDKTNNGKKSILLGFNIIDTLPEGNMQDLVDSLADNEKVPADEIMWEQLPMPNPGNESEKATAFKQEKLTAILLGAGILGEDEDGRLFQLDESIDLSSEPSADWFQLPDDGVRYIGISIGRDYDWRDKEKSKPKVDVIKRYIPLPESN